MEYDKEFDRVQEGGGEVFKPTIGVHKVKILAEPTETEYRDGENVTPQLRFDVEIGGEAKEKKAWFVGKGTTLKSVYGQLMALGKYKGKLADETITLSVTTATNRNGEKVNSYQIIEAVEILPKLEKPKVDTVA